jgi:glycosyltransferase involved in cell wall biosynthesis
MLANREPRLRVCMVAPTPFPANQGTPGSIREMAEAVSERGHEVDVVTYQFGQDIPVKGPRIHRIGPLVRQSATFVGPTARRPWYDLRMVFTTLAVIRKHPPDLLHAHGYEAALIAWLCRQVTDLPVLYSGHNTMADELASYRFIRPQWLAGLLARALDVLVPRLAGRCLPHSAALERFFHDQGLASRTDPVVPFGIDLGRVEADPRRVAALRQHYELGAGPVVLYTGLLNEFQRLDLLLEAVAEAAWYDPRLKLLVVPGLPHPEHAAELRRRAAALDVADRLVLTEPQPLEAMPDFLPLGDVAVVPRPQVPGFPIKLINYMAAGRPCVLFASSAGFLEDRKHARLAEEDTGASLGEAILEVLRDDELRKQIALGGKEYVRARHDRRVVARQVCEAYVRTLNDAGRAGVLARRPCVSVNGTKTLASCSGAS